MNRTAGIVIGALVVCAVAAGVLFWRLGAKSTFTCTFTAQQIQDRLAPKFPVEQQMFVLKARLTNPKVILNEGSDRIGLSVDADAELPDSRVLHGSFLMNGAVRYDPSQGALYLDDARVDDVRIEGISEQTRQKVQLIASLILHEYLARTPIYKLKPGDLRQDLARAVLRSVRVENGRLVVEVGLPR